jgi:hypothetical protein
MVISVMKIEIDQFFPSKLTVQYVSTMALHKFNIRMQTSCNVIVILAKYCVKELVIYTKWVLLSPSNHLPSIISLPWFPIPATQLKTDCHDITEILLKVALNTINQKP